MVLILITGWWAFRHFKTRETKPSITVGSILPLTGPASSLGKWIQNGYDLAVQEINEDKVVPGITIKVEYEDGMSDPKNSISALTKLSTNSEVHVITTTLSPVSLAILPIVKEKKLILFAAAAHPAITGSYDAVFRHNLTVESEADLLASYLAEKIKPSHARLVYVNDDYGAGFKDYWQSRLDKVDLKSLTPIAFDRTAQDLRPIAVRALSESPDCIVLVGYGATLGTLLRRIRESGFKGTVLVNSAMSFPDVRAAAGDAASGVFYTDYDINRADADYVRLNERYRARYGDDIPPVALFEHNTLILIARVFKETGGRVDEFATYLHSKTSLSLPGETVSITKTGDIVPKLLINRIP